MYLLKNQKNLDKPGALPGDVIVSRDFRKTYVVAADGSHRRVRDAGDHMEAVQRVKAKIAEAPIRRARAKAAEEELKKQMEDDARSLKLSEERKAAIKAKLAADAEQRERLRVERLWSTRLKRAYRRILGIFSGKATEEAAN